MHHCSLLLYSRNLHFFTAATLNFCYCRQAPGIENSLDRAICILLDMCNCGVYLWFIRKWKWPNVYVHWKCGRSQKKPNVFIFKEFFNILAYICVYNFVLVCVKICASWKIDCSVQRKRCFSLPTRRCFHTILLSPSFVSTQLEKMTFQILIYLYRPISKF